MLEVTMEIPHSLKKEWTDRSTNIVGHNTSKLFSSTLNDKKTRECLTNNRKSLRSLVGIFRIIYNGTHANREKPE